MALNSVFSWFIKKRIHQIELFKEYPHAVQEAVFHNLISNGCLTDFGRRHEFQKIKHPKDFASAVPLTEYEAFSELIEEVRLGREDYLWPGKTRWFAKSSGTTAGRSKFIPVTSESLEDCHYKGGKDMLALYYANNPGADVYSGKTLVLGGSSNVHPHDNDSYTGDLSAIIIRNLPIWVELKRIPGREVALMEDWEEKLERLTDLSMNEDVRMIAGVPSWTLVLLRRIMEKKGVSDMSKVWPNLELFAHGGVSFKPYRDQFKEMIPLPGMNYLETYNASEGFFAIQDRLGADDMLLMLDYGIYYEFIPADEFHRDERKVISLAEVVTGVNYALVISTNGGLWRYIPGDTVVFTSVNPYRVRVSGRTKHFINAFGEELIVENSDLAIERVSKRTGARVLEYTAAPVYLTTGERGRHEWLVEFETLPPNQDEFAALLDAELRSINSDYDAKRSHDLALLPLWLRVVPTGSFHSWLKSKGKLGGQHKVPRLSNERKVLESILEMLSDRV
jgi:hypothetical protein